MTATTDILTGTVKGPGQLPHEYLFITRDNKRTRIGEFVYYEAEVGDERRQIVGTIGYFSQTLTDFVNPRIPPNPGDPIFLASSETLSQMLSARRTAEAGSA